MIGTRHYEKILTLPAYNSCRRTLSLLALLLGVLPVAVYVLVIFLAIITLICPLTAAVVNKVFVDRRIGRPPYRFVHGAGEEVEEETAEQEEETIAKPFEPQFASMSAILFAISDATALFGLVLGMLGRGYGYAIPFFAFSLILTTIIYVMLKNQLFSLLSHHFDLIEGGGKVKLAE